MGHQILEEVRSVHLALVVVHLVEAPLENQVSEAHQEKVLLAVAHLEKVLLVEAHLVKVHLVHQEARALLEKVHLVEVHLVHQGAKAQVLEVVNQKAQVQGAVDQKELVLKVVLGVEVEVALGFYKQTTIV